MHDKGKLCLIDKKQWPVIEFPLPTVLSGPLHEIHRLILKLKIISGVQRVKMTDSGVWKASEEFEVSCKRKLLLHK